MTGATRDPLRIAILVSGRGSNMVAVLDAITRGALSAEVVMVLSDRSAAPALAAAQARGARTAVLDPRDFGSRQEHDGAIAATLRAAGAEYVVLAGYMRLVTAPLLEAFPQRVLNIHPSLLPAFPGLHAQAQALARGVRITGCTVHLVDAGLDTGPILAQRAVEVLPNDTEGSLAARILDAEHELLVEVLDAIAEGGITFIDAPSPAAGPARPMAIARLPALDARAARASRSTEEVL